MKDQAGKDSESEKRVLEEEKMKNKLSDLNNHLFEAIERLNNEDLTDEELEKEIKRSKAMEGIAKTIIESGNLALQARKHLEQYGYENTVELPLLCVTSK